MNAAEFWATALPTWAIPDHIMNQAPENPWIHPVSQFTPDGDLFVSTPSRLRAHEALPDGGSVLDIGCGGGRAAFGLVPPAQRVVGVDHQQEMLNVFSRAAKERNVECETVLGDWPNVADQTPQCDVVVCHHVFYNVAHLVPFVEALTSHAQHRVVVELPQQHPLSSLSPLWKHFWKLDRPTSPTAADARAVVAETGVNVQMETFIQDLPQTEVTDEAVRFTRIRLCLPSERDPEIRAFMEAHRVTTRSVATLWWDVD